MQKELKRQKIETYLNERVKPVFDRLIVELLASMPEDLISWSVEWLQSKGRKLLFQNQSERTMKKVQIEQNFDSNSEGEPGDDDEPFAQLPQKKEKSYKDVKMRNGVSAEVFGLYHKKQDFIPRHIQKNEEQMQRIKERMSKQFMFDSLDEIDQKIVMNAMEEKHFQVNEWVIKQGEDGNELYIVDSGQLRCFRTISGQQKQIREYQPGDSFGELALLYNAPRAASIQAISDVSLFALDRQTFNHIVKESSIKKREKFESMLMKIKILQSMDPYERTQLCDALTEIKFHKGTQIIQEGAIGDKFFMIVEGQLSAIQSQKIDKYSYNRQSKGDYFGELALFDNSQRQASVVAETDVDLIYLHKDTFKRLLGPIEEIIKRNIHDRYNQ